MKGKTRVLHLVHSISPLCGGPTHAILSACRGLMEHGFDAAVATTDTLMPPGLPLGTRVEHQGVPVYFFPHQRFSPAKYGLSWAMTRWLKNHVAQFDLVHVHSLFSHPTTAAGHYANSLGVPLVISPEGTLDAHPLQKSALRKRVYLRLLGRRLLQAAAVLEFRSEVEREDAAALGLSAPSVVIPIGVTPIPTPPAPLVQQFRGRHQLEGKFTLLYLSRLDPIKGLELTISALARLKQSGVPLRLLVAGAGHPRYERRLRELVRQNRLKDEVEWLGMVQGQEKELAFASADVFVLSSHHENFGVSTAEALSCGLPVVITRQVGISRLVAEYGAGLVTERDAGAISGALLRLQADAELRRSMSARARRLVLQQFDPQATTRKLVELYRRCLDSKPQSYARGTPGS